MSRPSEADEARALRLVLASIDDDLTQLAAVAAEVANDPRGDVATWQIVVVLANALGEEMLAHASEDNVKDGIRLALLDAAEGVINA